MKRPLLILGVVILVEGLLFTGCCRERWRKSILPLGRSAARAGEGLVIRCDGLGYYAWLRSLLLDGDWAFDNEFDHHNVVGDYVPPAHPRTPRGRRPNPWSIGPACAWAPLVVPAHMVLQVWRGSPWPADGYSLPYQLLVGCGTLLASFAGLGLTYGAGRCHARPESAALAAACLLLGTTVVYYSAVEGSMAHGLGTAAVAGLVCYWLRTYGSRSAGRWLLVGVLTGVAALVRWQLATFAVLPAGECLLLGTGRRRLGLALAGLGAIGAFTPQMIAWRTVYGAWLVTPYPVAHNWLAPSGWQVLASPDRGLFYWTPLVLVAVTGAVWGALRGWSGSPSPLYAGERGWGEGVCAGEGRPPSPPALLPPSTGGEGRLCKRPEMALLLVAFAVQVYVVASVLGAQAYLGVSYGFRPLTESVVVLAPGLACALDRLPPRVFRAVCTGLCLLVLWNLILVAQYRYGWVPADAGATPGKLQANAARFFQRKHGVELARVLVGPMLLLCLVHLPATPRRSYSSSFLTGSAGRGKSGSVSTIPGAS